VNPYLTGNRIYRGASNAPTRGTVDPMGYIDRSLASAVGGDGQSDQRSGLAQAAMQRIQGMNSQPQLPQPQPPHPEVVPYADAPIGFQVDRVGRLIPIHPDPVGQTQRAVAGVMQPPESQVNEAQLMQAARDRLMHHISTKEMLAKHHLSMEKLQMQAAEAINRHGKSVRGPVTNG